MRSGRFLCALVSLLLVTGAVRADAVEDARVFARHGLKPNVESIAAHLRSLYADEDERKAAELYVSRLGDADRFRRDEAIQRLAAMGARPIFALRDATSSSDPETRRTAQRLLSDAINGLQRDMLAASLRTVARRRMAGVVRELVFVAPLAMEVSQADAVFTAVAASARPEDIQFLLEQATATNITMRATAVRALGAVLPPDRLVGLQPFLAAPEPRVRLAAAWALADRGLTDAVAHFPPLLECDDIWVRLRAARALRHISGTAFGYAAYASKDARAKTAAAWRAWVEKNAPTAKWTTPLDSGTRPVIGHTLVTFYSKGKAVVIDGKGNVIWTRGGMQTPWACEGMPNGHRLIVEYSRKRLVEYDARGRLVWTKEGLPGFVGSVQRLENGNVLLSVAQPGQLLEIRRDGSIAWKLLVPNRPSDARLLANGNLLVTLSGGRKVVEMDRRGKVVWSVSGKLRSPYSASRTPSGTTLVADMSGGRVIEFDRGGKVIWELGGLRTCYTAQRLENGHTLVADQRGLREVDRGGRTVWSYAATGYIRFHRY